MKMGRSPEQHDEMQAEYDFRSLQGVVRGKYAGATADGQRTVRLEPDVAAAFPDELAVNAALRQFLAEHPPEKAG
jgi:hypothetical protein